MSMIDYTNMDIQTATKKGLADDVEKRTDVVEKTTFVFYKNGGTLVVLESDSQIPFPYDNVRETYGEIEVKRITHVETFIMRTVEILKSRFANDYLTELSETYPESEPVALETITADGSTTSLRHGFVVGWSEESETIGFISAAYKDADNDNGDNAVDKRPITAMMMLFSYALFTHSRSPILREIGDRVSQKYMNLLSHDVSTH